MSNELTLARNPGELTEYLKRGQSAINMALPKHLNSDRMLRLAVTCWSTTPGLRNCTPQSILGAIVVASQLGLEPGIAGQAYLIPYKNTCTLVPGWSGLVSLLNNSGRATAWTGAVFEGDTWEFELGSNPKCRHVPGPNFGEADKMTWVYACGKVNGSELPVIEAWPISRVWRHRDKFNKVGNRHYSFEHPEMYARKVVLLQVLKYMPRSIELQNAITAADASEIGRQVEVQNGNVIEIITQEEAPTTETLAGKPEEKPAKVEKPKVLKETPAEKVPDHETYSEETPAESSIASDLAEKLTNNVARSGVALKFFISAIVSAYPKAPASLKLLSELDADTLDSIDTKFDSLVESARTIAEKRK